jgi:hypothetical protein
VQVVGFNIKEKKKKSDNIQMDRACGAEEGAKGCGEET